MRKSIALLLVLACLTSSNVAVFEPTVAASSSPWNSKAPVPTPRYDLGIAVVDGKIYAIGGRTGMAYAGEVIPLGTNEMYDPVTNTWTTRASMPTPRFYFGIAVLEGKIYVMGGQKGFNMANSEPILCPSTEVYDPATNTWENRKPMPTSRTQLRANTVGDKIYLIGGKNKEGLVGLALNEVYDPSADTWTTKAPPPVPSGVWGYGSAVVDDKVYIMAGSGTGAYSNMIYDPENDSWGYGAPIPTGDFSAAAATLGPKAQKKIYVLGGGWIFGSSLNQIYDVENNSWSVGSPMPTPRNGLGLAVVDDILYAIGGANGGTEYGPTGANEQYTPWYEVAFPSPSPLISILSPANTTYAAVFDPYAAIPLIFETNESLSWVGYSLDGGSNITAPENGTLIEISVNSRSLTLYANDTSGNWAAPQTVYYEIAFNLGPTSPPEPFPTTILIVASVVTVAIVSASLLVYFKKRGRRGS